MAFAVFGMTEVAARQIALRRNNPRMIDTGEKDEDGEPIRRKETPEEFEERMQERVRTGVVEYQPIMISQEFDAPQFCNDFIGMCRRVTPCSRLHVRHKDAKTGRYVEWVVNQEI